MYSGEVDRIETRVQGNRALYCPSLHKNDSIAVNDISILINLDEGALNNQGVPYLHV